MGCSSASKQKKPTQPPAKQDKSGQPIKTAVSQEAWKQSLGRVSLVNEAMGFVLMDIGTAPAPDAGTRLQTFSQSTPSAELVVSNYQKRPFLIADVISGNPKLGDTVTVLPAARRVGSAPTESPAASEPSLPTAEPLRIIRSAPAQITQPAPSPERINAPTTFFIPTPEPEHADIKPEAPASELIIPGLPTSRKKQPE